MTATGPAHDTKPRKLTFTVPGDGEDVPAVAWLPGRPAAQRPLVLLGHGGGLHKETPYIARLGNWMASGPGYAALAIDLPYHGDRTPAEEKGLSAVERHSRMGLRAWRERNSRATGQAITDWKAAIAAVQNLDPAVHAPIGYLGFSMGTRFGIPLAAAEPRITAAVFGLFGHPAADTQSAFARAARQVTIPVLYLLQWNDELFPREDGLALFDLLATRDKIMHVNPGGHIQLPRAEEENAAQFLRRRLGGDSGPAGPARPAAQGTRNDEAGHHHPHAITPRVGESPTCGCRISAPAAPPRPPSDTSSAFNTCPIQQRGPMRCLP